MGLINYKNIDFNKSINKENKIINFNGSEIQIVKYLPANDKYDLIMITLQKSLDKNIYNPFKIDMYFDLNVVYLYTNIVFNAEDRVDEAALYDIFNESGLIAAVKENIDADEYTELKGYIYKLADMITKYRNTFGAAISSFVDQLPKNMEHAKEIISEFDPEKYSQLLNTARQINANSVK